MKKTATTTSSDSEQASLLPQEDPVVFKPENDRVDPTSGDCHDVLFAIAFVLQLVAVITAAVITIPEWLRESQSKVTNGDESPTLPLQSLKPLVIVATAAVALLTSLFYAAVWLYALRKYSRQIVQLSLATTCSAYAIAGAVSLALGQVLMGVIFFAIAGLIALFFLMARYRIKLAATTLQISTSIIKDNPGPIVLGFSTSFVLCLWALFWGVTTMSVVYAIVESHLYGLQAVPPGLTFALLLSFFWTVEVVLNVAHVTTAGVVGSWWFGGSSSNPTVSSLGRAVTTSFGSICFGSLIVAALSTFRALLNAGRDRDEDRNVAQDCLGCIVGIIENLVKLFNVYVFSTIAINGTSFLKASRQTMDLFSKSGMDLIINDDLSSMVLMIGTLPGLLLTIGFSAATLLVMNVPSDDLLTAAIICGGLGFLLVMTVVSVLRSCVATIFVCWAQDPSALYRTHTNQYVQLRAAMENIRASPMTL